MAWYGCFAVKKTQIFEFETSVLLFLFLFYQSRVFGRYFDTIHIYSNKLSAYFDIATKCAVEAFGLIRVVFFIKKIHRVFKFRDVIYTKSRGSLYFHPPFTITYEEMFVAFSKKKLFLH